MPERKDHPLPDRDLQKLRYLLDLMGVRKRDYILPVLLSFMAAFFEGVGIGLLIPLIRGIINKNFAFLDTIPVLKAVIFKLPHIIPGANAWIYAWLVLTIFASSLMKVLLQYVSSMVFYISGNNYANKLRKLVFSQYLSFGKLFFDSTNAGYLQHMVNGHIGALIGHLGSIKDLIGNVFMLAAYLAIMLKISWKLTLVIFLIFPALNYSLKWLINKIRKTSRDSQTYHRLFQEKIFNVFSCIPLVKAYTAEKEEIKSFSSLSDIVARFDYSMAKKNLLVGPIQELVMLSMVLLLVSIMALLVAKDPSCNFGNFLVYLYLIRKFMAGAGVFSRFKAMLAVISGSTDELYEVFDDKGKFYVPDGRREFPGLRKCIDVKHLDFHYVHGSEVLKDISFSVESGKTTAIVGLTGSGKTTIISLLLRFYDCAPSRIFIDGTDIREFTLESLRSHMALVSQDTLLFNDTLMKNITYGTSGAAREEIMDVIKKARLHDFVSGLPDGLKTYIGDRGVKLSGGERQRVSIARALLKKSEILILDEATSSLDSITENMVQDAIEEAMKGRTSIVIAHRLSTVKKADKVIAIEDGSVFEQGTVNELLDKKGKFYSYWQAQKFD